MAVRSRRLFTATGTGTDAFWTAYTVPAGRTAIIRSLVVVNGASVARTITVAINVGSTGRIVSQRPLAALETFVFPALIVLNPGDALLCRETGGSVWWSAFGTLLLGAPI